MSDEGKGVMLFDNREPKISGYLIIGNAHYQIVGERISDIRTNLTVKKIFEDNPEQKDMFDEPASDQGG